MECSRETSEDGDFWVEMAAEIRGALKSDCVTPSGGSNGVWCMAGGALVSEPSVFKSSARACVVRHSFCGSTELPEFILRIMWRDPSDKVLKSQSASSTLMIESNASSGIYG